MQHSRHNNVYAILCIEISKEHDDLSGAYIDEAICTVTLRSNSFHLGWGNLHVSRLWIDSGHRLQARRFTTPGTQHSQLHVTQQMAEIQQIRTGDEK